MLYKFSRADADEKMRGLLQQAGYSDPTILQDKIIPLSLQGKDLFVETLESKGKTAAVCIPALLRPDYSGDKTRTLLIASSTASVTKTIHHLEKLQQNASQLNIAALGVEKNPKKELRYFKKNPEMIIGTTERIIDHIRRDNLDIQDVELLIIYVNTLEEPEGFIQDVLFILSKTPNLQQRIIFADYGRPLADLIPILHRPQIFYFSDWSEKSVEHTAYFVSDTKEKVDVLKALYFMGGLQNSAVICKNITQAVSLEKKLKEAGIGYISLFEKDAVPGDPGQPAAFDHVSLLTQKTTDSRPSLDFQTIIYYQLPYRSELYAKTLSKLKNESGKTSIISLVTEKEQRLAENIKEEQKLEIKSNTPPEKETLVEEQIKKIIHSIKGEENPEVLDKYKKIFKKNVPLSLRSYFTAYLLKNCLTANQVLAYTTLFVSIGKNRKVYPKDLARLFSGALSIESSEIGQIKVLESYSFIDVPSEKAASAIETLNGQEFRGRKITVNYARKKES